MNEYNKNFWKLQGIKIDWQSAIKQAADYFYKNNTIESAKLLLDIQRLYKNNDIDGYLNLLDNNKYLIKGDSK